MIKKILHITPTDITYDSRILKELKVIEDLENCQLLAFGISDNEGQKYDVRPLSYVRTFNLFSKRISFLPRPVRYFLNLLEATIRLTVPAIRYGPNVIHCHDTLFLPIALVVKFFCKSKLIYDAHELESDKGGQSKILSKYTLFIEKISWGKIDLLISVSPSIIEWYNRYFSKKNSLLILNSPYLNEEQRNEVNTNYFHEKFNIPTDKKIFLYLGIISKLGRGIDLYLSAFKNMNIDSHVVFMGYGGYVAQIQADATLYSNIHYHPVVSHDEVVEISRSADVGLCLVEAVSLSDYYCLPNKLFEYAFSGLFVLGSDFPDIKNIIDQYSIGQYCDLNEQAVYNSIKDIEKRDIIKVNKNLYQLSWAYQAKKLKEEYNKILNN